MERHIPDKAPLARIAGALYLVIIIFGVWSELAVRSGIFVPGDANATAANILAHEGLFRLSLAADTVMALCDVALAILLYVLLSPHGPLLTLLASAFRLVQTAILGMNLLNHHAALLALESGMAPEIAQLSLLAQSHGYDLGLLFFGVNAVLLGVLILRSGALPRLLGGLLVASGAVYLTGSYLRFLAPDLAALFEPAYLVPLIGESAFCLWLLFRGMSPGAAQRQRAA